MGRCIRRWVSVVCTFLLIAAAAPASSATSPVEYWPSRLGGTRNSGFNPHETVIGPRGVGALEPVWSTAAGLPYGETPVVAGRRVFLSCGDYDLCAFSTATGRRLWRVQGTTAAWPAVSGGMVFTSAENHPLKVVAVRADSGEQVWSRTFPDAGQMTDWPTVRNGMVYFGASDGYLYALDAATGAIRWRRNVGGAVTPAFSREALFAVISGYGYAPHLRVYDAETGAEKWEAKFPVGVSGGPVVGNGYVFLRSEEGDVAAFDTGGCNASLCGAKWYAAAAVPRGTSPAVAGGVLYFADYRGGLYALSADDGRRLWSSPPVQSEVDFPPTVANGIVYVANEDQVRAFRATGCGSATCRPLWRQRTAHRSSWSSSAAVLANGRLLLSADGALYRFSLPSDARTDPQPPVAPTNVVATAYDAEATLAWTPPADLNGFPVIGHRVHVSDGRVIWTRSKHPVAVVKGLTNGATYTFTVEAISVAGVGPRSAPSNVARPDSPHSAPTGLTAIGGTNQATVSWTPSPHTFGDDTLEYYVYAHPKIGSPFLAEIVTNVDTATVSPLNAGHYTFTVMTVAHNVGTDHSAPSNGVHVAQ